MRLPWVVIRISAHLFSVLARQHQVLFNVSSTVSTSLMTSKSFFPDCFIGFHLMFLYILYLRQQYVLLQSGESKSDKFNYALFVIWLIN